MKPLFRPDERTFARAMGRLISCNHFLPERIACEREALGGEFVEDAGAIWNLRNDSDARHTNIVRLTERAEALVKRVGSLLRRGAALSDAEQEGFEHVVYYHLYQKHRTTFQAMAQAAEPFPGVSRCYESFAEELQDWLAPARRRALAEAEIAELFAGFSQLERAFLHIFTHLVGSSAPAARLRAAVWESIFTCNFQRYRRSLFRRMHEITTLIAGPSGTGKELVAQAIAGSAFIPFDPATRRFAHHHRELFWPLNLSAVSVHLVEAELFGHRQGSFTGALQDRAGWLETCPPGGAVFLDEIGELEPALQVKLLRVLQTRIFHRLGESRSRTFRGKIIAATNRDLVAEMEAGRFRRDFYYRLCADVIVTPSLREQLADRPDELPRLVGFVARRLVGDAEADGLAEEVLTVVRGQLGADYAWPGNFRELEQCVRNVMVRRRYEPVRLPERYPAARLAEQLEEGALTAEQVLRRYCALVFAKTGTIEETARRLNLDRRTVKAKLVGAVQ